MTLTRRMFLAGAALTRPGAAAERPGWMSAQWKIDPRCVLPRGPKGSFDSRVAGDPCVVWDGDVNRWRMFYFASPGVDAQGNPKGRIAGMALSRSPGDIGPGDWTKAGPAPVANPFGEIVQRNGHKFWVVMDPFRLNRSARIDGRYWGLFVVGENKHIYAASAARLAGPWTVVEQPILSPGQEEGARDGRHCDTPTAYWFAAQKRVLIFYKAYPREAQARQPEAPFGSSSVVAWWRPPQPVARKGEAVLLPGRGTAWNRGWVGGFQLLRDERRGRWYALLNGSPTPPEDRSHREPPPSLAGWAVCAGEDPASGWKVNESVSPLAKPDALSAAELAAGLGVNFWRHHLLVTPSGRARIFFNSGPYGTEQMYSLVPA